MSIRESLFSHHPPLLKWIGKAEAELDCLSLCLSVIYLSPSLSLYLCTSLNFSLSPNLYFSLTLSVFISMVTLGLWIFISVCISLPVSLVCLSLWNYLSVFYSPSIFVSLCISHSLSLSTVLPLSPSICIHLSISHSICISFNSILFISPSVWISRSLCSVDGAGAKERAPGLSLQLQLKYLSSGERFQAKSKRHSCA